MWHGIHTPNILMLTIVESVPGFETLDLCFFFVFFDTGVYFVWQMLFLDSGRKNRLLSSARGDWEVLEVFCDKFRFTADSVCLLSFTPVWAGHEGSLSLYVARRNQQINRIQYITSIHNRFFDLIS